MAQAQDATEGRKIMPDKDKAATHSHAPESSLIDKIEWFDADTPTMVVHLKG